MTARRPLLTATAAGSVLFALWFVPSANAIVGTDGATDSGLRTASAPAAPGLADDSGLTDRSGPADGPDRVSRAGSDAKAPDPTAPKHFLADTGSPDTTPYVVGGAGFLALGAALVAYSVRRAPDETA
ncbi:hypothetical protein [Streptomyces sp. BP-8]|uniref:LPXTG cell wall anchor domain-containing protein n=1 Tax=Streptomyces sirii TaxID=3127701 RepID=A0ABZ2R069_9ACTN